jgi:hypothetical protein
MDRPVSNRSAHFLFLLSTYMATWDRRRLEDSLVVQRPYYTINIAKHPLELTTIENPLTVESKARGNAVAQSMLRQERSEK